MPAGTSVIIQQDIAVLKYVAASSRSSTAQSLSLKQYLRTCLLALLYMKHLLPRLLAAQKEGQVSVRDP